MSRRWGKTSEGLDRALAEVRNMALEEAAKIVEQHHFGSIAAAIIRGQKSDSYPRGRWAAVGRADV